VENSYCSLDLLRTSSTTSGNTRTVIPPVTFKSTLAGEQQVKVIVTDWSGETGQLVSSWDVAASAAPPVISAAGIVNGASWAAGGVAPGEIVTIFGSGWVLDFADDVLRRKRAAANGRGDHGPFRWRALAPSLRIRRRCDRHCPLVFGQYISVEVSSSGAYRIRDGSGSE